MPVNLQHKQWFRVLGFYVVCILGLLRCNSRVLAQQVDVDVSNVVVDSQGSVDNADDEARSVLTGTKGYNKVLGIATQEVRFYYRSLPNKLQESCDTITVLYVGVGTAMNVNSYDNLSRQVVLQTNPRDDDVESGPVVVMIADASRNNPIKLFGYANFANVVYDDMSTLLAPLLLPGITVDHCDPRMVIGGHSASGGAAAGDYQKGLYKFTPAAFLGLDPFSVDPDKAQLNNLATVNVGFTTTTCGVTRQDAAEGAYMATTNTDQRVLYQIQNDNAKTSGLQHCAFTGSGCAGPVCPNKPGWYPFVYELVGEAATHLVAALRESAHDGTPLVFDRDQFSIITATNVTVFVGKDVPATIRSRSIKTGVRYIPAAVQRLQKTATRLLCGFWLCGAWSRTRELFAFGS